MPKVCTYHSAKGLSFDSVFLPWFENASFDRDQGPARRRLPFVALTRASNWTFLGRSQVAPFDEDPWLTEAGQSGALMLQQFIPFTSKVSSRLKETRDVRSNPVSIF